MPFLEHRPKNAKRPFAQNIFRKGLGGDDARFLKTWFGNPLALGAVSPSGRFLARMMAHYVDPKIPGPIVELGPGTGPITQALLRRGIPAERLILVEYEISFCRLLERRFPGATIIQGDAYRLRDTLKPLVTVPAASIVSSLPLLNKPPLERLKLLLEAFTLLDPAGNFIQFTYGMMSPLPQRKKNPFFLAEASPRVWLNLPPARVWSYRPLKRK